MTDRSLRDVVHQRARKLVQGSTWALTGGDLNMRAELALSLVQMHVCTAHQSLAPCGQCGACLRVAQRQSESLLWIAPSGSMLRLEDVEPIHQFLRLCSFSSTRWVVIQQAQQLGPAAANAILKSLEEPPPASYFLLLAPSSRQLLPTIRSRTQTWSLGALISSSGDILTDAPAAADAFAEAFFKGDGEWWEAHTDAIMDTIKDRDQATQLIAKTLAFGAAELRKPLVCNNSEARRLHNSCIETLLYSLNAIAQNADRQLLVDWLWRARLRATEWGHNVA